MDYKELLKKPKKYARKNEQEYYWETMRGKGGHGTVHIGDKFTVVPTGKGELKTGTQKAILRQLGVNEKDL